MSSAMTTGIGAAAALGAAMATGVVAGLGAERLLMARSFRNDEPTEPYGTLRADPRWVTADDGTELYVEIDEPDDPGAQDVTIIFSHGYSLNLDTWHYQRRDLRGHARLVFWDQRSHGRSGRGHEGSHTIDQLGSDLGRVLDECAPTGRVMLVGHSMGGMTIMGLAGLRPQLFGSRVLGAALLATSSGHLDEVTLRLPAPAARIVQHRTENLAALMHAQSAGIDRGRTRTTDLNFLLTKRYSFGEERVSRAHTQFVADLLSSTPIDVVADYLPEFGRHDKVVALAALQRIATLIMVGDSDALTPESHSRVMLRHIPGADLVVVPQTGHMIISERPDVVDRNLLALLDVVRAS